MTNSQVKFSEIVRQTTKLCKKCFTIVYTIPCETDQSLADFFNNFGKSKYNLDILDLFLIESEDGYEIKNRLANNYIYFSLPLHFKNGDLSNTRKKEFEDDLKKWMSMKLKMLIV